MQAYLPLISQCGNFLPDKDFLLEATRGGVPNAFETEGLSTMEEYLPYERQSELGGWGD